MWSTRLITCFKLANRSAYAVSRQHVDKTLVEIKGLIDFQKLPTWNLFIKSYRILWIFLTDEVDKISPQLKPGSHNMSLLGLIIYPFHAFPTMPGHSRSNIFIDPEIG